jgi:hypothetical protein
MKTIKAVLLGIPVGFVMGLVLFMVGAILAMIFWQGAPPGKFSEEMIPPLIYLLTKLGIQVKLVSPIYFLLTKLGFGIVLGAIYGLIYSRIAPLLPTKRIYRALLFGAGLWFVAAFPIFQITLAAKTDIFWQAYSFGGLFLFGLIFGILYKTRSEAETPSFIGTLRIQQWLKVGLISGIIMGMCTVIISIPMAIFAEALSIKFFTLSEIISARFILSVVIISLIWGVALVHVYLRLKPIFSVKLVYSALFLGLLLWFIRWSFDIVHKICYSQTPILTLAFNYFYPFLYFWFFNIVIAYLIKKWRS